MANDRSLNVSGQITNLGGLDITEIGFAYDTTDNPNYYSTSGITVPLSGLRPNNTFSATITGLTENTSYWVRSYAKNSLGLSQSVLPTMKAKTTGVDNKPTITCNIINMATTLPQLNYEIGTTSNLIVSGETIQNDELIFSTLILEQTSIPQPTNPIKTLSGLQLTYTTATNNPSIIFTPISSNIDSQQLTQTVTYTCGNPSYDITANVTANAYFPYLWVLKGSLGTFTDNYFAGIVDSGFGSGTYFYRDASATPTATPSNGKLIEGIGFKTILMSNTSSLKRYLAFGYPASYGNCWYSVVGQGTWQTTVESKSVGTGALGYTFGITTGWTIPYNIIKLDIGISVYPTTFLITFTNPTP